MTNDEKNAATQKTLEQLQESLQEVLQQIDWMIDTYFNHFKENDDGRDTDATRLN